MTANSIDDYTVCLTSVTQLNDVYTLEHANRFAHTILTRFSVSSRDYSTVYRQTVSHKNCTLLFSHKLCKTLLYFDNFWMFAILCIIENMGPGEW